MAGNAKGKYSINLRPRKTRRLILTHGLPAGAVIEVGSSQHGKSRRVDLVIPGAAKIENATKP